MKGRLILTAAVMGVTGAVSTTLNGASTLVTGELAPMQFNNSDTAYLVSHVGMAHMNNLESWVPIVVLGLLVAIWWTPLKTLFTKENQNVQ